VTAPTLCDRRRERKLRRDGYAIVRGLASDRIDWLREVHQQSFPADDGPGLLVEPDPDFATWDRAMAPGRQWRIGVDETTPEQRAELEERLAPYWAPIVRDLFCDHRVVFSSFLTKGADEDSVLPLHQHPTIVDETEFTSVTLWIALDEISQRADNGALHVLAGSHLTGYEPRGTNTAPSYIRDLDRLWPATTRIDVAAGDAIIWDSRVLHGSPPNRSQAPRRTVTGLIVPRRAELRHVVAAHPDAAEFEVVRTDDAFYRDHSPRSLHHQFPEEYPVIGTIARSESPATADDMLTRWESRTLRGRARRRLRRMARPLRSG
jgi:hypothetical protein